MADTAGQWHALIDCYGRHRKLVARSNWLYYGQHRRLVARSNFGVMAKLSKKALTNTKIAKTRNLEVR